jgi:adenylate cyclase class IV
MKTEEEIKIWEALELLTRAEYAISTVAAKTEDKYIYRTFANAADEIKKIGEYITPLRGL